MLNFRRILHFKPIENFCFTPSLTCLQIKLGIINEIIIHLSMLSPRVWGGGAGRPRGI